MVTTIFLFTDPTITHRHSTLTRLQITIPGAAHNAARSTVATPFIQLTEISLHHQNRFADSRLRLIANKEINLAPEQRFTINLKDRTPEEYRTRRLQNGFMLNQDIAPSLRTVPSFLSSC